MNSAPQIPSQDQNDRRIARAIDMLTEYREKEGKELVTTQELTAFNAGNTPLVNAIDMLNEYRSKEGKGMITTQELDE